MPHPTYRVHLTAQVSLPIQAAKVNPGERCLWFYDQNNHLIGLFSWAEIVGFTVEGSAEGQVLTDRIPIEMGIVAEEELGLQGRRHLETFRKDLQYRCGEEIPF